MCIGHEELYAKVSISNGGVRITGIFIHFYVYNARGWRKLKIPPFEKFELFPPKMWPLYLIIDPKPDTHAVRVSNNFPGIVLTKKGNNVYRKQNSTENLFAYFSFEIMLYRLVHPNLEIVYPWQVGSGNLVKSTIFLWKWVLNLVDP